MSPSVTHIVAEIASARLEELADPAKAAPMQAYMKTDMPFRGVQKAGRMPIARELRREHPPTDAEDYRAQVMSLWSLPHREEKYLAIGVAVDHPAFVTLDQLDLYEFLIRDGAWWDFVDDVASRLVGRLHLDHPAEMTPVLRRWIGDEDLWIRRSAIIAQLRHRDRTDVDLLFELCAARAHETEFFIRKAIGWALREHAKTDPEAVWGFVDRMGDRLSGLSRREATKHRVPGVSAGG